MGERAIRPTEIATDVLCIGPHGRTQTNVYLVRGGSSWMLADAGWAGDAARISDAVRSVLGPGVAPAAILATHAHPDHTGAARTLAEAWRCCVLLLSGDMPMAMGDFAAIGRFAGPLDRWLILPAMRAMGTRRREAVLAKASLAGLVQAIGETGEIPGLEGWSALPTPGHTPGHASFVRAADRVVLTGDALVTLRVNAPSGVLFGSPGLSGPPRYTTWSRAAAAASVRAIAALEPSVIGGGHGKPMTGPGTADAVREFAARSSAGR